MTRVTLILSFVSGEYILQVSDRRLVDPRTGRPVHEAENKAVIYCGHVIFGYTGLARISGRATDIWLAQTLQPCQTLDAALKAVRTRATADFRQIPPRLPKQHAFVAAGWARGSPDGPLRPFLAAIRNFDLGRPSSAPADEFTIGCHWFEADQIAVLPMGQLVRPQEIHHLARNLRRATTRRAGPWALARLLLSAMREASRGNPAIGPSVMVCSMPRHAVERGESSVGIPLSRSGIDWSTAQAFYIPADSDDPITYGPTIVCAGDIIAMPTIAPGFRSLPPPDIAEIERRLGL